MTEIMYVVLYSIGGYAREDADTIHCAGVFTDEKLATIAKRAVNGQIVEKVVNQLEPGYLAHAKALGFVK